MAKLNYRVLGNGEPLMILHGLFGSLDNWATLGRKWAEDFTVYLMDLRNHGKSPHLDSHGYPEMAKDIVEFFGDHGLRDVNLVGHSMGGKVAMEVALEYGDLLRSVTIADMGPGEYSRGHDEIFAAMNALDLSVSSRRDVEEQLASHLKDKGIVFFLSKNLKRTDSGFEWKFNKEILERDYENILLPVNSSRQFDKPALFLKGENSNYIREKDMGMIKTLFPQYQLNIIENAGHWIHADNPDRFYTVVNQFLHKL